MDPSLNDSVISLGFDLLALAVVLYARWSIKLYWVSISALWVFDYFLTLESEVIISSYLHTGRFSSKFNFRSTLGGRARIFWFFILNRYLAPCFIMITLTDHFAAAWDLQMYVWKVPPVLPQLTVLGFRCKRYVFMETLETMLLTFTAEVFLTLRVFALLKRNRAVPAIAIMILSWQWGIAFYAMSQSSQGTVQNALLLSRRSIPPELPVLPDIDPYHICLFITTLTV
ncbi:hypothetical protein EYR40_009202 [Pleurotus pulmonarius]|nr:hypothetical protein EYR40_009202 [Pleurotus pulmonarius]